MFALQNFATEHPEHFVRVWAILHYNDWDDKSGHWTRTLKTKEERDIG